LEELKEAANTVSQLDMKMERINREINKYKKSDDIDDEMHEILINNKKFNIPHEFFTRFFKFEE